jgi:uncharacterized protein YvpB
MNKMNKKGLNYMLLISLIILVLVYTIITSVSGKFHFYDEKIGTTQFRLIKTYEKGEKALNYIDMCFERSLRSAVADIGQRGGLINSKCSTYKDFNIWDADCYPSQENVKTNLKEVISNDLIECFNTFPDEPIPYIDYTLDLSSDKDSIQLVGRPSDQLRIDITDHSTYNFKLDSISVYQTTEYSSTKAPVYSNDQCTYCYNLGWEKFWGDTLKNIDSSATQRCSGKKCCKADCPPNTKLLSVPYTNQCQPDLVYGKDSSGSAYGWQNFDACLSMCGVTSVKMVLDYYGRTDLSTLDFWPKIKTGGRYSMSGHQSMADYLSQNLPSVFQVLYGPTTSILRRQIDAGKPVIVGLQTSSPQPMCYPYNFGHIVVVDGYSGSDYIIINDPYTSIREEASSYECTDWSLGHNLVLPTADFERMWTGLKVMQP